MRDRTLQAIAERIRVSGACSVLWMAYGAAAGVALNLLAHHVLDTSSAYLLMKEIADGALGGAGFGAIMGCGIGLIGQLLGGRVGWSLAGAVGGLGSIGIISAFMIGLADGSHIPIATPLVCLDIATWSVGFLRP